MTDGRSRSRLRVRLTALMLAIMALFTIVGVALNSWLAESSLLSSVDRLLETRTETFPWFPNRDGPIPNRFADAVLDGVDARFDEAAIRVQVLDAAGTIEFGDTTLPIDPEIVARALDGERVFRSVEIDERPFRVMTIASADDGSVLQATASIESIDEGLGNLRTSIVLAGMAGIALAGVVVWIVAGRFLQPIRDVASATSQLASDAPLPAPISADRDDEIGELVTNFNTLVAALHRAADEQERLVADASHELRTPLTSLRVKIDFLDTTPDLDRDARLEVIAGAAAELEALTELVTELVMLARRDVPDDPISTIALGDTVGEVADLARRASSRAIRVEHDDTAVRGHPAALRRAIRNLIDNAVKYSPDGTPIDVRQTGGTVEVRDRGAGIADADRERAFDRFYRSPGAQPLPGSGIGLSIVREVAERHGGRAWISGHDDGGTVAGFSVDAAIIEAPAEAESQ